MIKEKELSSYRPDIQYMNGNGISLQSIQNILRDTAGKYQIPINFYYDQVGGLLSKKEECLVLFHPQHQKDYCKFVITIRKQGMMAFVSFKGYGSSKNIGKLSRGGSAKQDLATAIFSKDVNESAAALGRSLVNGVLSLGGNKAKKQEEQDWYSCINQIINEAVS